MNMNKYTTPIIDITLLPENDVLTASADFAPKSFEISESANNSDMSRQILNSTNSYKYINFRKLFYQNFSKLYGKNGFIDFEIDLTSGNFGWKIELPQNFDIPDSATVGELIEQMKTINSKNYEWHCDWMHKKFSSNSEMLPELYVPVLVDDDISESYIAVPPLSSISTWSDYCNFIENLITSINAIDFPLYYVQNVDNSYSFPVPLYTQVQNADGTDTYEFFTNLSITVKEV